MRRADHVGGVLCLALGTAYAAGARQFPYWTPAGPGSGFLPFWLGVALALLGGLLLLQAGRRAPPSGRGDPAGREAVQAGSLRQLLLLSGATLALLVALPVLGLILASALFLLGVLRFLERRPWRQAVGVAAAMAILIHLVFARWLRVPLPLGPLGF